MYANAQEREAGFERYKLSHPDLFNQFYSLADKFMMQGDKEAGAKIRKLFCTHPQMFCFVSAAMKKKLFELM